MNFKPCYILPSSNIGVIPTVCIAEGERSSKLADRKLFLASYKFYWLCFGDWRFLVWLMLGDIAIIGDGRDGRLIIMGIRQTTVDETVSQAFY